MSNKWNEDYIVPEVEIFYVNVEKGFAGSTLENPDEGFND